LRRLKAGRDERRREGRSQSEREENEVRRDDGERKYELMSSTSSR